MKFSALYALATASVLVTASVPSLPQCAELCFIRALGKTNCGPTDYYCQCTTGAKVIDESATSCLCANVGTAGGCSESELADTLKASNDICSSALAAKGSTFTPLATQTACPAGGATGGSAASASATATGKTTAAGAKTTGASAGASAASGSASSATSGGAAAPTNMAAIGGAVLGVAGMLVAAL